MTANRTVTVVDTAPPVHRHTLKTRVGSRQGDGQLDHGAVSNGALNGDGTSEPGSSMV